MLLSFASAVILFLTLSSPRVAINWASSSSNINEAEIDAALQNAAAAALADRDGTIIVMDAQTGRVRAIVGRAAGIGRVLLRLALSSAVALAILVVTGTYDA